MRPTYWRRFSAVVGGIDIVHGTERHDRSSEVVVLRRRGEFYACQRISWGDIYETGL